MVNKKQPVPLWGPAARLCDWLKICRAVLAEGADVVLGKFISLIDVAAYLADVSLFALGLLFGFGLDVVKIVLIGYGGNRRKYLRFAHVADKESMTAAVGFAHDCT